MSAEDVAIVINLPEPGAWSGAVEHWDLHTTDWVEAAAKLAIPAAIQDGAGNAQVLPPA